MVIAAILFKYRANPENISKQLSLFGATFPLTGTPDSPVALIMSGRQTPAHASYAGYWLCLWYEFIADIVNKSLIYAINIF